MQRCCFYLAALTVVLFDHKCVPIFSVPMQIELHGGRVQRQLTTASTHILLLGTGSGTHAAAPRDLLFAASDNLGGINALRHLKKGLANGHIKLVPQR